VSSLFRRLKQRKLVQWAIAYLAGAWFALEVMDVLGGLFDWSLSFQRGFFFLLVLGFFAALVVAWFHGERGHQKVTGLEVVVLAGVVCAVSLGYVLVRGPGGDPLGEAGALGPAQSVAGGGAGDLDRRPSVAVLPFRDLSPGGDQAYFADGVHEEIIAQLSRIRSLKVISRTSVMRYAEGDRAVAQIAEELGVASILEGGVRHDGDSVRITATLIDAARDESLWSAVYGRGMAEIFAIQEDVAREIVEALSATLTSDESRRLERQPTESLTAYELYLLSRHSFHEFGPAGLARSVDLARRALAEDSTFALAWTALGQSLMVTALGHGEVGDSPDDEIRGARAALARALALDPHLAEARSTLALILATHDYDWETALRESAMAVESAPGNAAVAEARGLILSTAGLDEEAIAAGRRAVELDPLAPVISSNLGWIFLNAGRFAEAVEQGRRSLQLEPDFHDALTLLGRAAIRTGRFADAAAFYRRGAEVTGENPEDLGGLAHALARGGDREGARQVLGGLLQRSRNEFVPPLHIGYAYLGLGEDDEALRSFEQAVEEGGGWNVWLPRYPEARHLHGHPRFRSLVNRMGLTHLLEPPPR
jgi:TolB-like protein/Tfp pilus assembly protein PilF